MKTAEHLRKYCFKPGQSGNKNGRPKALFTKADVEVSFQRIATLNLDQLDAIIKDPKTSNIDASIAAIWKRARTTADYTAMEFLLSRAVGKVKEEIDQTTRTDDSVVKGVPTAKLLELVNEDPDKKMA